MVDKLNVKSGRTNPSSWFQPAVLWLLFLLILVFGIWFSQHRTALVREGVLTRIGGQSNLPAAGTKMQVGAVELQESFSKVAFLVKPAVVNISAIHVESYEAVPFEFYFGDPFEDFFKEFFGQPQSPQQRQTKPRQFKRKYEGTGSGVIIDQEGYILTNEHVIRGADEIKVTLTTDKGDVNYPGKVVGRDAHTDLAVVKIKSSKPLPYAKLGDSEKTNVGDWAIAIGSPFGLEQTVTVGVVSAVRQSLLIEGKQYKNLIQTDAAINRGNSGGPLVNINGEVIGINTAIYAPTGVFAGIGFATPINQAKQILDDLIQKGRVIRGWMGVEITKVDEVIAKQFGLPDASGVLINRVIEGSPADRAGLKRGDVVRKFNGKAVESVENLQSMVSETAPNKSVKVSIIRDGKEKGLELVIGEMPAETEEMASRKRGDEDKGEDAEVFEWKEGARVSGTTKSLAARFGFPENLGGVVIIEVEPGSSVDSMGLLEGDLVRSVNRMDTPSLEAFKKVIKKVDMSKGIVFDINRRGRPLYISYQATK